MRHRRKIKGEQVITPQMDQQLKTKHINVTPGQLFCSQCKDKFFLETETHCIDDEDKVQFVTDNDKLTMNSLNVKHQGKCSNQLAFHLSVYTCQFNAVPQYNPISISEAYKVQVDCLEDLKSDSYDKKSYERESE